MNAHVPQSLQTQEELIHLCAVSTQIISPSTCKPIISVVQDICTGLYRLTKDDVTISEKQLFNLMSLNPKLGITIPNPKIEMEKSGASGILTNKKNGVVRKWTGHQLLSTIIPEKINLHDKTDRYDENKSKEENFNFHINIKNGEISSGAFHKDVYQARSQGIVHQVYNEYGPEETKHLLDNTQKLICSWLVYNGFSVGVSDMVIDGKTEDKFKEITHEMKRKAYEIINEVHTGNFKNETAETNQVHFEEQVNKILNKAISQIGKAGLSQIDERTNRLMNMINSKSKGNTLNVAQMMGSVGQQNVEGRRIPYGFDNRTLPHYTKFDDGPEARGFIENSFITGLTPQEFYFHAMGGREGLIDTAVSSVTADTPIIIIENGKGKHVRIGDWIDQHLDENKEKVKFVEKHHMELLEFDQERTKVYIPTCDEKGVMSWGEMTAITRHDTINGVYEMKTESGRYVKVTGSKSLLIYRDGKIVEEFSANVKVGDFVPINESLLEEPPVQTTYIDMQDYFPKTEYLYGTEFNKAVRLMEEIMVSPIVSDSQRHREATRTRVPKGWWERSNGTLFQLPFTKKASLQRTTVRSNTENIIDGAIYPYHAKRDACQFPDKLELNFENGAFIGLFIADGHADPCSGQVVITKEDESIIKWVQNWCSKYNITTSVSRDKKKIGVTTTTRLRSTLLERFLTKLVGTGAKDKYFPEVAFTAPIDFVKGLISGYISGDGHIASNSDVLVTSVSKTILDGLNILCSRIGVLGFRSEYQQKTNNLDTANIRLTYRFRIHAHWVAKFCNQVTLIHNNKNEKLRNCLNMNKMNKDSFVLNNVFLDRITSMEKLEDDSMYPKVYDVTIPSTFNFCLGDGLCTRDTAETGYLQRKLIKAMEDCKVNYDGTVRNAGGSIVQFLYGEDGMDPTKVESQVVDTVKKTHEQVVKDADFSEDFAELKHFVPDDVLTKMAKDKRLRARLDDHVRDLLEDRDFVIQVMFKGEKESKVSYPVHFGRMITIADNTQNKFGKPVMTDLYPEYVLDRLEEVCGLHVNKHQPANKLLSILAHCHLSPKRIILRHRLTKNTFDMLIEQIKLRFYQSFVSPCEMVGVIAAQSIGEPSTQLTLNSFHSAGISSASKAIRGVPRLKELLDMTKEIRTPIMTVKLKEHVSSDKSLCLKIINDMHTVRFKDVVKSLRIYFDPDDFNTAVPQDQPIIDLYREFNLGPNGTMPNVSPWLLRLEFDKARMEEFNLDMIKIYQSLDKFYEDRIFCLNSDDNAEEIVMRIKLSLDSDKATTNSDDILTELRALEFHIMENFMIKGINRIEKAYMPPPEESKEEVWDNITKEFVKTKKWMVITDGSNMQDVMSLDVVDDTHTVTNDVNEVYSVLGIEAARAVLYEEIVQVLSGINYRHVALLIDVMTNRGNISSVNRHGINRGDIGPLAKCSFEETTDKLVKAGMFSEYDKINGVAANVIMGQIAPAGTGDVDIFLDDTLLPKMSKMDILGTIDEIDGRSEEMDETFQEQNLDIAQEQSFNINMDFPVKSASATEITEISTDDVDKNKNQHKGEAPVIRRKNRKVEIV